MSWFTRTIATNDRTRYGSNCSPAFRSSSCSAAALLAIRLNASCRNWLIYAHRSSEHGDRLVLDALGAEPILDLKLRLGEGSGAALALPIVRLACALHAEMATFTEANVSEAQ